MFPLIFPKHYYPYLHNILGTYSRFMTPLENLICVKYVFLFNTKMKRSQQKRISGLKSINAWWFRYLLLEIVSTCSNDPFPQIIMWVIPWSSHILLETFLSEAICDHGIQNGNALLSTASTFNPTLIFSTTH